MSITPEVPVRRDMKAVLLIPAAVAAVAQVIMLMVQLLRQLQFLLDLAEQEV